MNARKLVKPRLIVPLVIVAGVLVIGALIYVLKNREMPIVNVHESVESVAEIVKLQTVMADLGMTHTVLHGIPKDLLYFEGEGIDLGEVEENNEALMRAVEEYPEQFSYFCSLDPNDPLRLDVVAQCAEDGASGVKLYNGYSYAHQTPLDDAKLNEFYTYLTENDLPLMLPVNTTEYEEELRNLLTNNPELTVICPHFCLSSKNLDRLSALMTEFPNLYVDTSFGHEEFVVEGFETIRNNKEAYQSFFEEFQDRILFATDSVLTSYEDKDIDWVKNLYGNYLTLFTSELDLPKSIQKKVLYQNWMGLTK